MSVSGPDIEIDVREGPDILETRRCRTMLMPDGRVGAVWRVWSTRCARVIISISEVKLFRRHACTRGTAAPTGGRELRLDRGR